MVHIHSGGAAASTFLQKEGGASESFVIGEVGVQILIICTISDELE